MQFAYTATNQSGETVKGALDAPDKFSVARLLRRDGLTVLSVADPSKASAKSGSFLKINILQFFKLEERVLFARNLSGMLSAGLALARSLQVLGRQTSKPLLQNIFNSLMEEVSRGGTLSSGLEKFPRYFSSLFVSMVRSGEESGTLAAALKEISIHLERSYSLRRKIRGAMTYPVVIIVAMLGIGILMFIYVVPTLTQVFTDLNVELPWSTQMIISISNFLKFHTLVFLGVLIAIGVGIFYLTKLKIVQTFWDALILRLPIIGSIARQVNSARTTRTLSTLITAGVSITKALEITREVVQNVYYKKVLEKASSAVQKGQTLSTVFKSHTHLYPAMVGEMMEVGEETGNLAKMLSETAIFYEDEVDIKTKNVSTIIEPVLMIIIGAAVGFFAVSILTPMYSILQNI